MASREKVLPVIRYNALFGWTVDGAGCRVEPPQREAGRLAQR